MRLDFNVLCIDDQPNAITGAIDSLRDHVEDEGFRLKMTYAGSLDAAILAVDDHVLTDGIDLVLVDYDLGSGSGGEHALARVRNAMPYKEVVFYSARATAELRKLAYEAGVEGVYCATRTSLGETVVGVFDALVKKVLDIDHCRGIILGATSDLEHLVNDMLLAMDGQITAEQRVATFEYAIERMDETLERFQKIRDGFGREITMESLLEAHQLFTSVDRLKLLLNMHDHRFDKKSGLRKAIGQYINRFPRVRNMFAHVRLSHGQPIAALRPAGNHVEVNAQALRAVRKELIEYRDQFQELADRIQSDLTNG
jgi:CheY-like chemotaxis protein